MNEGIKIMHEEREKRKEVVEEIEKETTIGKIGGKVIQAAGEAFKRGMISYAEYFQLLLQDVGNIHLQFIEEDASGINDSIGAVIEEFAVKVRTE